MQVVRGEVALEAAPELSQFQKRFLKKCFLPTRPHKPVNYASFGKDDKVIREPSMFRNCPELEKENVMPNAINVVTLLLFVSFQNNQCF